MNMSRAHAVAALILDQLAHRPIHWNRVAERSDRLQDIVALNVGGENTPKVALNGANLNIVKTIGASLPNGDLGIGDRLTAHVGDASPKSNLGSRLNLFGDLAPRGEPR